MYLKYEYITKHALKGKQELIICITCKIKMIALNSYRTARQISILLRFERLFEKHANPCAIMRIDFIVLRSRDVTSIEN